MPALQARLSFAACPSGGFFIACNPFVTTRELARPRPPLLSRVGYY
jgi:hypothetical protein